MKPVFFAAPNDLRTWFLENGSDARELWVGYFKKRSGKQSITWPESVDEALCVGWIDGIRKRLDDESYMIRFTPRRPGSIWSGVNIERVKALMEQRRMQPSGLAAFATRRPNKSGIYSYEQRSEHLPEPYAGLMRQQSEAWDYFQAQPPSYRKAMTWWVVSARQEQTRRKRLERLIAKSMRGRRLR